MRKKSYYSAKEITNNLYTNGNEWQLSDGTEYRGLYHTYTTDETYTGAVWDAKTSEILIPFIIEDPTKKLYKTLKPVITKYNIVPNNAYVVVTTENRNQGFVYRYFIRKINETNILEIDEAQYSAYISNSIDPNLYVAVKLTWYITGNIQDEKSGNVVKPGVITKNLAELKTAEQIMFGITAKLTNLIEYYTDSDFVVPKDINE